MSSYKSPGDRNIETSESGEGSGGSGLQSLLERLRGANDSISIADLDFPVDHHKFGRGKGIAIKPGKVPMMEVDFKECGVKDIVLDPAYLTFEAGFPPELSDRLPAPPLVAAHDTESHGVLASYGERILQEGDLIFVAESPHHGVGIVTGYRESRIVRGGTLVIVNYDSAGMGYVSHPFPWEKGTEATVFVLESANEDGSGFGAKLTGIINSINAVSAKFRLGKEDENDYKRLEEILRELPHVTASHFGQQLNPPDPDLYYRRSYVTVEDCVLALYRVALHCKFLSEYLSPKAVVGPSDEEEKSGDHERFNIGGINHLIEGIYSDVAVAIKLRRETITEISQNLSFTLRKYAEKVGLELPEDYADDKPLAPGDTLIGAILDEDPNVSLRAIKAEFVSVFGEFEHRVSKLLAAHQAQTSKQSGGSAGHEPDSIDLDGGESTVPIKRGRGRPRKVKSMAKEPEDLAEDGSQPSSESKGLSPKDVHYATGLLYRDLAKIVAVLGGVLGLRNEEDPNGVTITVSGKLRRPDSSAVSNLQAFRKNLVIELAPLIRALDSVPGFEQYTDKFQEAKAELLAICGIKGLPVDSTSEDKAADSDLSELVAEALDMLEKRPGCKDASGKFKRGTKDLHGRAVKCVTDLNKLMNSPASEAVVQAGQHVSESKQTQFFELLQSKLRGVLVLMVNCEAIDPLKVIDPIARIANAASMKLPTKDPEANVPIKEVIEALRKVILDLGDKDSFIQLGDRLPRDTRPALTEVQKGFRDILNAVNYLDNPKPIKEHVSLETIQSEFFVKLSETVFPVIRAFDASDADSEVAKVIIELRSVLNLEDSGSKQLQEIISDDDRKRVVADVLAKLNDSANWRGAGGRLPQGTGETFTKVQRCVSRLNFLLNKPTEDHSKPRKIDSARALNADAFREKVQSELKSLFVLIANCSELDRSQLEARLGDILTVSGFEKTPEGDEKNVSIGDVVAEVRRLRIVFGNREYWNSVVDRLPPGAVQQIKSIEKGLTTIDRILTRSELSSEKSRRISSPELLAQFHNRLSEVVSPVIEAFGSTDQPDKVLRLVGELRTLIGAGDNKGLEASVGLSEVERLAIIEKAYRAISDRSSWQGTGGRLPVGTREQFEKVNGRISKLAFVVNNPAVPERGLPKGQRDDKESENEIKKREFCKWVVANLTGTCSLLVGLGHEIDEELKACRERILNNPLLSGLELIDVAKSFGFADLRKFVDFALTNLEKLEASGLEKIPQGLKGPLKELNGELQRLKRLLDTKLNPKTLEKKSSNTVQEVQFDFYSRLYTAILPLIQAYVSEAKSTEAGRVVTELSEIFEVENREEYETPTELSPEERRELVATVCSEVLTRTNWLREGGRLPGGTKDTYEEVCSGLRELQKLVGLESIGSNASTRNENLISSGIVSRSYRPYLEVVEQFAGYLAQFCDRMNATQIDKSWLEYLSDIQQRLLEEKNGLRETLDNGVSSKGRTTDELESPDTAISIDLRELAFLEQLRLQMRPAFDRFIRGHPIAEELSEETDEHQRRVREWVLGANRVIQKVLGLHSLAILSASSSDLQDGTFLLSPEDLQAIGIPRTAPINSWFESNPDSYSAQRRILLYLASRNFGESIPVPTSEDVFADEAFPEDLISFVEGSGYSDALRTLEWAGCFKRHGGELNFTSRFAELIQKGFGDNVHIQIPEVEREVVPTVPKRQYTHRSSNPRRKPGEAKLPIEKAVEQADVTYQNPFKKGVKLLFPISGGKDLYNLVTAEDPTKEQGRMLFLLANLARIRLEVQAASPLLEVVGLPEDPSLFREPNEALQRILIGCGFLYIGKDDQGHFTAGGVKFLNRLCGELRDES